MSEVLGIIGQWALVLLLYVLGSAATAGYFERRDWWSTGPSDGDGHLFAALLFWPVFWFSAVVWRVFIRPLGPLVKGVYRLSAGMTFLPDEEEPTP